MVYRMAVVMLLAAGLAWAQPGAFDLSSPANGAWASATPAFSWTASASAVSYRLVIDGATFVEGITSTSYTVSSGQALNGGMHTWAVVAVASGGTTTQSTQLRSFLVDAAAPGAFGLSAPGGNTWSGTSVPMFSWAGSYDAGTGLRRYELWIDGARAEAYFRAGASFTTADSIPPSVTSVRVWPNLSRGTHTWYVVAVDSVGNRQTSSTTEQFRVDIDPPVFAGSITRNPTIIITWGAFSRSTDAWRITDAGGNTIRSAWFDPPVSTSGYRDTVRHTFRPGTYYFNAIATTGWTNSGNFSITDALTGSGTYYVRSTEGFSNGRSVTFVVGEDGTGQFAPGGSVTTHFTADLTPTLRWRSAADSACGAVPYRVLIDDVVIASSLTDTTLVPPQALAYGRHTWYAQGVDSAGNVPPMYPLIVYVDNLPPAAFGLLSPADSVGVSLPTPTLSWQGSTDTLGGSGAVRRYQVWIDGAISVDSTSATSTSPGSILAEGRHTWYVKAFDQAGNARSSVVRTLFVDYNLPGPFSLLLPAAGDTVRTGRPLLTWSTPVDAGGIRRYIVSLNGQPYDTVAGDTTLRPLIPLTNGTYTWSVVATDWAGNSVTAPAGSFVVAVATPSQAPALVTPGNTTTNATHTFPFVWRATANAETYDLDVSTDSLFASYFRQRAGLTDTTNTAGVWPDTLWKGNQRYYWRVRAANSGGKGPWSATWSFTTAAYLVSPPYGFVLATDTVTLSWYKSSNVGFLGKYWLEIFSDSLGTQRVLTDSTITDTTKRITIPMAWNKTPRWWRVRGQWWIVGGYMDIYDWQRCPELRLLNIDVPTTATLIQRSLRVQSALRGSALAIQLWLPSESKVSATVYTAQGRIVSHLADTRLGPGAHELPMGTSGTASGLYMVHVTVNGTVWRMKVTRAE